MCLICKEFELGKLTWKEALNNAIEASSGDHQIEILNMLGKENIKEETDEA